MAAAWADASRIASTRLWPAEEYTRVIFEAAAPIEHQMVVLRNPDRLVVYFNYGAVDPALTNDRCNFWHFRFDADADMKMAALTSYMATQKRIAKVYLINQDYAFGQAVARAAREMLAKKRPDIQVVGDDLHPLGKVKDFSPYIAKIKASGADTVVTGNWGADLALLVRAGKDAGLSVDYYTYYAGVAGGPAAIGEAGDGHVRQVSHWFNKARLVFGFPYWSLSAYLKNKVKNAVRYVGEFEQAVAAEARRRGADGVVCGHIHKAEIRDIDGVLYCNDGDWVESCTALVEQPSGELEILRWAEIRRFDFFLARA